MPTIVALLCTECHRVVTVVDTVRTLRRSAGLTQIQLATLLGVSNETVRTWDSGRRQPPTEALRRIRSIVGGLRSPHATEAPCDRSHASNETDLKSLRNLAVELGVSVYTLREAARMGHLAVTYSTRVAFGRPVPTASVAAGRKYLASAYGLRRDRRPKVAPPKLNGVPDDFDVILAGIRHRLRLTQAELASALGAANRAVVYQWESRKRRPSPVFWQRVLSLVSQAESHRSRRGQRTA